MYVGLQLHLSQIHHKIGKKVQFCSALLKQTHACDMQKSACCKEKLQAIISKD